MKESAKDVPSERQYKIDMKSCIVKSCDGELAEISYYERNNWLTVELECNTCKRRFVLKVEA